jgi:hypothetical protein
VIRGTWPLCRCDFCGSTSRSSPEIEADAQSLEVALFGYTNTSPQVRRFDEPIAYDFHWCPSLALRAQCELFACGQRATSERYD